MNDAYYMSLAQEEAKKAFVLGEVPVGALLVHDGKIIARAHNLVESLSDATAHAEMLCMRQAAQKLANWRLKGTTLYCTLEPCAMCAGALILSRVETLVWGAPDKRHGVHGSWANLLDIPHPIHQLRIRQGVLADSCGQLMVDFFKLRRINGSTIRRIDSDATQEGEGCRPEAHPTPH